jgi:hypothetical protein
MEYSEERVVCDSRCCLVHEASEQENHLMRIKLAISCVAILVLVFSVFLPRSAAAQVNVQVQIATPTIRFETRPVLVEVSPGVQVVEDYDDEVFFVDGWYWYRSGPGWYRTRDHRGGWVVVQERSVPRTLVRIPHGRYKHYRGKGQVNEQRRPMAPPPGRDAQFKHRDHDDRQDHRDDHRDRKDNRGGHGEHKEHHEGKHGHR